MTTTASFVPRINLNALFAALLCGGIAGVLIGGVVSRLSMRVVALLIRSPGSFSWEGTLGILLIGGVFGVIFGAIYHFLRGLFPLRPIWQGAVYGGVWAVLVCYFFVVVREGELGLIGPAAGMALFAPIPIVQGAGMAWLLSRIEKRLARREIRSIPAHWFAGLLLSLLLAAGGMGSLAGEGVRLPALIFEWTSDTGVGFARTKPVHQFLGVLFVGAWLGLSLLIFGLSSHTRGGKLTTLGLLLMAAGLFHAQPPFTGWMSGIPVGRWSTAALMAAGAAALAALLLSLPARAPRRWEMGVIGATFAAVLIWNGTDLRKLPLEQPAGEWVLWIAALVTIGGGALLALRRGWRIAPARLPALAWVVAVTSFLAIWAATLLDSRLNIQGIVHPFAPLGVTLYLLPWLLPLIATVLAARKRLWGDE